MNGQTNIKKEVSPESIFSRTKTFPELAKNLRERLAFMTAVKLSRKMKKWRYFADRVEAGKCLAHPNDIGSYATALDLNEGLAKKFKQKWQTNYLAGIEKVFFDHPDDSFPKLLKAIRETVGVSYEKLSVFLGKHPTFISQVENPELNIFFSETETRKTSEFFGLAKKRREEFMARRDKHYANWCKRPRGPKPTAELKKDAKKQPFLNHDSALNGSQTTSQTTITQPSRQQTVSGLITSVSPLLRLCQSLCIKYGFVLGLEYLQRNGKEINISNLKPEADSQTRLLETLKLAKILKLRPRDALELATVFYYTESPQKRSLKIQGDGAHFLELIILLAAMQADISVC